MTVGAKRGGVRPGAGRKPKSPSGEVMRGRSMRWTDAQWADVLLVTTDRVRELVSREATRLRKRLLGER